MIFSGLTRKGADIKAGQKKNNKKKTDKYEKMYDLANEAYDIAYANARTSTDTNLLEIVEKEMIQRSLKECGGNQVKSSAMLGITRATLRKRIDAHSIRY